MVKEEIMRGKEGVDLDHFLSKEGVRGIKKLEIKARKSLLETYHTV